MTDYSVAIVGAGFCGTMVAVQYCRLAPLSRIALIERNDIHGPGLAYGTVDPDHLLNVRAGQMGAFPDDPGDFYTWVRNSEIKGSYTASDFLPRQLYGAYLKHKLQEACTACPGLSLVRQHIVSIRPIESKFELTANDGRKILSDKVVLALGNFPPDQLGGAQEQNPYSPALWKDLADDGDVLIVGTGLTSLDLVVTLAKTKKAGRLHLLSRHGLLPREHVEAKPYELHLGRGKFPTTTLKLYEAIRQEIALAAEQGLTWHSTIDALRPFNQKLWQDLDVREKQRFLRHLRAYWDVHRHRCAAKVMDAYRALEQERRIVLHHGHILSQTPISTGWYVEWRPRGAANIESFDVGHIIRCTGPQPDIRKLLDPLVQDLLKSGLITPDPLYLGIATADDYTVLGKEGRIERMYALGSVLKGRLYESVAVPELRAQACDVAYVLNAGRPL